MILGGKNKIKVLIADGFQIMIDGLKKLLVDNSDIMVIGEATNGKKALELLDKNKVDIAILNIALKPINGLDIAKYIRSKGLSTQVLILNIDDRKEYFPQILKAKIDGFICREKGANDLLNAIDTLSRGKKYFGKEYNNYAEYSRKKRSYNQNDSTLTQREIEIVKLITQGLTTPEMGEKLFISKHTVLTHRKNIMSKLNIKNAPQLVRYAMSCGLS